MRYAIRHENTCIVTFFIYTNLFLARPYCKPTIFCIFKGKTSNSWNQLVSEHNKFLKKQWEDKSKDGNTIDTDFRIDSNWS